MIGNLLRDRYWTVGVGGLLVLLAGVAVQQLRGERLLSVAGILAMLGVLIGLVAGVVGVSRAITDNFRRRHTHGGASDGGADAGPLGSPADR